MMAGALIEDFRSRVSNASNSGMLARQAAARFSVGVSGAIRRIARAKLSQTTPQARGRQDSSSLNAHDGFIVGLIDERKDITLNEMMERLVAEWSVRISCSAARPDDYPLGEQVPLERARGASD